MALTDVRRRPGCYIYEDRLHNYIEEPGVTEVTIPDGVRIIGQGAFQNCRTITSVVMPDSVMMIEASAFQGCEALRSVRLSEGLLVMRDKAFWDCKSLTHLRIPDSLRIADRTAPGDVKQIEYRGLVFEGDEYTARMMLFDAIRFLDAYDRHFPCKVEDGFFVRAIGQNPEHPALCAYIEAHYEEIFHEAVFGNDVAGTEAILRLNVPPLEAELVDGYLEFAIQYQFYEIQLLLMQYKNDKIGYSNPTPL